MFFKIFFFSNITPNSWIKQLSLRHRKTFSCKSQIGTYRRHTNCHRLTDFQWPGGSAGVFSALSPVVICLPLYSPEIGQDSFNLRVLQWWVPTTGILWLVIGGQHMFRQSIGTTTGWPDLSLLTSSSFLHDVDSTCANKQVPAAMYALTAFLRPLFASTPVGSATSLVLPLVPFSITRSSSARPRVLLAVTYSFGADGTWKESSTKKSLVTALYVDYVFLGADDEPHIPWVPHERFNSLVMNPSVQAFNLHFLRTCFHCSFDNVDYCSSSLWNSP